MALPKAVQDQVSQAEKIMEDLRKQEESASADAEAPVEDGEAPDEQASAPEPEAAPEQPQAAPEPPKEDQYEQKYKVLQGKYNAEVPRLQRQVNELTGKLQDMERLLAEVNKPKPEAQKYVTPEEIEEYGPEFMDIVGRRAQEIADQKVGQLNDKIRQLESQLSNVGQYVQKSGREKVFALLDANVKDWEEINNSPEWDRWLGERDVLSGIQRGRLLHEAYQKNDAPRVLSFFEQFQREHAAVQPSPSPQERRDSSGAEAEKMVAPGRGSAPSKKAVGAQDNQRVYTQAEIAQFYEQKRKGMFKNNPERAAAIEQDIIKAGTEGRIVQNGPTFVNAAF